MTKKRKRRKPEQVVKLLQEGEAMLAAGKSHAEVYQKAETSAASDTITSGAAHQRLQRVWLKSGL